MRSANERRLARIEEAIARRPSLEDMLRSMSDAELMKAVAECHERIEAFERLEPLLVSPREHRA